MSPTPQIPKVVSSDIHEAIEAKLGSCQTNTSRDPQELQLRVSRSRFDQLNIGKAHELTITIRSLASPSSTFAYSSFWILEGP
eukprot:5057933-Amphidinium_carterae.1